MKKFELFLEDIEEDGVFGISLVNNPAMESEFILLDKEDKQLFEMSKIDKKKNTITGVALVPNKMIPRKQGNEIVEVYFSAETIKEISQNYLKNYYQFNTTIGHEKDVDDVYMTEAWLVEDPENDKTNAIGLKDVKKDSWVITLKVENDDVLKQIEDGTYKGFSIEGFFAKKLTQLKKEEKEMKKTLKEKILSLFDKEEKEEVIEVKKEETTDTTKEDEKDNTEEKKTTEEETTTKEVVDETKEVVVEKVDETKEEVIEVKKEETTDTTKEDEKDNTEEKKTTDEEKTTDEPSMKDLMDAINSIKEENDELKKKLEEKPIPEPKLNKQTDTIPQSFHSQMNKVIAERRKKMGLGNTY